MRANLWTEHAPELARAYAASAGTVRFEVVTRLLLTHLPPPPQRIVDVGGGFGRQAVLLARAGHTVVVVDIDQNMLAMVDHLLSAEPGEVASRVSLVLGDGLDAARLVGTGFDLACCHSVLMYEDDPAPMLRVLVELVRGRGFISVICINRESVAMRSGLQGRWQEAIATLEAGRQVGEHYLPAREHTRDEIESLLDRAGASVTAWQGVGVFTDHLTGSIEVDDLDAVVNAEWLAGNQDPYRDVARCFHLLAQRRPASLRRLETIAG